MNEFLHGYGDAAFETALASSHLGQVKDALSAFATALTEHENLRRVVLDPGITVMTKAAVVRDLLVGTSEEAVALIVFALRVGRCSELPVSIRELIELVVQRLDTAPAPVVVGVLHTSRNRTRGYAEGVLRALPDVAALDEVEDELFRFARLLDQNHDLLDVLSDPGIDDSGKVALLHDLLASHATLATLRLASYVVGVVHARDLVGTFDWLVEVCAEERGWRVAEVRSASELDRAEREELAAALTGFVGRPVEIRTISDETTAGGLLVSIGDVVIDGTIRSRLERLRDAFAH